MSTPINDIQKLINDKADAKLRNQLQSLQKLLYSGEYYNLISNITINVGTAEKPKNIGLYSIFSSDGFEKKIIENNTQRFREQEAKDFIAKVESLRQDVDYLLENKE